MKANEHDKIKLTVTIRSEFSSNTIPKGSEGVVIECYSEPEYYSVDIKMPAPDLIGGFAWENVMLTPDQFELIHKHE